MTFLVSRFNKRLGTILIEVSKIVKFMPQKVSFIIILMKKFDASRYLYLDEILSKNWTKKRYFKDRIVLYK